MALARTLFTGISSSSNSSLLSSGGKNTSRIRCCAAAVPNAVAERLALAPTKIQILPSVPQILESDGSYDDCEEVDHITFIDYDRLPSKPSRSRWMTSQYLDLRLRCSALISNEAKDALSRHFKGRTPAAPAANPTTKLHVQCSKNVLQARNQERVQRYVRPISDIDLITECIFADTQHEYFKDSITFSAGSASLEEAFC